MKNIFLIGFMGTGKSAISRQLNIAYGLEIIEMDELIAKREGMGISDIFAGHGEEYFRNLETSLLMEFKDKSGAVVSCGGGVPLRDENVQAMKDNGTVVLLTASAKTIYDRVKNGRDRPLLNNNMNIPYIEKMLAGRMDKYTHAADITIATDGKTKEEIAKEIIDSIGTASS